MRSRARLVALLLLAAAWCGEEDRTPTSFTPSVDRNATSSDDLPPRLPTVAPAPADTTTPRPPPGAVTVSVVPAGGVGPAAQSRLVPTPGGAVAVSTRLAGGRPGSTYAGAVHQGACTGIGATVASLVPVTADSLGTGTSASELPLPLDSLTAAPHVVVFGTGGRAEACGEIGRSSARPVAPDSVGPDSVAPGRVPTDALP